MCREHMIFYRPYKTEAELRAAEKRDEARKATKEATESILGEPEKPVLSDAMLEKPVRFATGFKPDILADRREDNW